MRKVPFSSRWIAAWLLFSFAALCLVAGCTKPSEPPPSVPISATSARAEFVGSAACAGCHPTENLHHSQTGHAHTLRLLSAATAKDATPPLGRIPGTKLVVRKMENLFVVGTTESQNVFPLQYVFGSGKQGVTYTASLDNASLFEMHYSYFPATKKWVITPGHEQNKIEPLALGMTLGGEVPRKCLLCHVDALPETSLQPDPKFKGVGCESCHGAGSLHIAAAQTKGVKDLLMEDLSKIGGKRMNALCGKCHRDSPEVLPLPESQRLSQRFFPYGLAQSQCFQKSADRLSCSTCHDPHTNASTDRKKYETRCLSCHAATIKEPLGTLLPDGKSVSGGVCKVNPTAGCIPCHLPKKNAFPGTPLPIQMADHWIRVQPGTARR